MNLGSLVKLILRANRAGRTPGEPWETDARADHEHIDAERFTRQLARLLPQHAEQIRQLAFPPLIRVQVWCDTFGCDKAALTDAPRDPGQWKQTPCPRCGNPLHVAPIHPFVYVHPNLFDVWTLEAPCQEAAEEKFAVQWEAKGSHLTSSSFDQGKVLLADDYEATP